MICQAKKQSRASGIPVHVEVKKMFIKYDSDGNGRLQMNELSDAIQTLNGGCRFSSEEVAEVMKWYDNDHRGTASCSELVKEAGNKSIITTHRRNIISGKTSGREKPQGYNQHIGGTITLGLSALPGIAAEGAASFRSSRQTLPSLGSRTLASSSLSLSPSLPLSAKNKIIRAGNSTNRRNHSGLAETRSHSGVLPLSLPFNQAAPSNRDALVREKLLLSNKLLRLKIKMQEAKMGLTRPSYRSRN
jgi:hypothetical protein